MRGGVNIINLIDVVRDPMTKTPALIMEYVDICILVGNSENDHDKGCKTLNPVRPILSVPWKLYEGLPRSPAAYLT